MTQVWISATGVSMSDGADVSWTVSFGIALQNVPEGMVIIAPLLLAGVSRMRTFVIIKTVSIEYAK